ncbi:hypothetical protein TELCIR_11765 [Teladorsagia circumcincta]|uniref:Uncharacterized protein n=1 Tax=Teladorsagia circumcincta TaxID=45464 RepID=A0A2G9UAK7_TELCI|nr:hypothetical protein TELCIR_11765 [Teladorsagia circumcincta]
MIRGGPRAVCSSTRYKDSTITDLVMRYEKPDPRNRWDSPLYEIKIGRSERNPEEAPDDMGIDLEHPSPKFVDLPLSDIYSWMCEVSAESDYALTTFI